MNKKIKLAKYIVDFVSNLKLSLHKLCELIRIIKKNRLICLQILFGIAFLLQPIILPAQPNNIGRSVFSWPILKNVLANALIIVFFYFNYFILIPHFYFNKKYVGYIIGLLFSLSVILIVPSIGSAVFPHQKYPKPFPEFREGKPLHPEFERPEKSRENASLFGKFQDFFADNDQTFFMFSSIAFFSILLRVTNRYYKTENAKQEAEINYLLAQINPHFLFNVLNNIYTLTIREKASTSSESLLKLSGLLRYIFTETNGNIISLEKEISCLNDFIDLQKLRLTDSVDLKYAVSGELIGKQIAPMLLLPFIENAFKHGVSSDENSIIDIKIDVVNKKLEMYANNTKVAIGNDAISKSGLGIANAKNRLQLIYPDRHTLDISETEQQFTVTLKISL
jgi:hypothetical protein